MTRKKDLIKFFLIVKRTGSDFVHSTLRFFNELYEGLIKLSKLNPQETEDLATFTEEILNGKLHFLCSAGTVKKFGSNLPA